MTRLLAVALLVVSIPSAAQMSAAVAYNAADRVALLEKRIAKLEQLLAVQCSAVKVKHGTSFLTSTYSTEYECVKLQPR